MKYLEIDRVGDINMSPERQKVFTELSRTIDDLEKKYIKLLNLQTGNTHNRKLSRRFYELKAWNNTLSILTDNSEVKILEKELRKSIADTDTEFASLTDKLKSLDDLNISLEAIQKGLYGNLTDGDRQKANKLFKEITEIQQGIVSSFLTDEKKIPQEVVEKFQKEIIKLREKALK